MNTKEQNQSYNHPFISESALEKRLGTSDILDNLSKYLTGKQVYMVRIEGGTKKVEDKFGEPLVNEKGHQAIMGKAQSIINSPIAQGNLSWDLFHSQIMQMRQEFAYELVINQKNWAIDDDSLHYICNLVINAIKLFLTRPVENKERESYNNTMKVTETNSGGN
jgi:hypothetical protein